TETYINEANYRGLCGFSDWRLPTVEELRGVVQYSSQTHVSQPDAQFFPNQTSESGSAYWTATASASNVQSTWCVESSSGDLQLCQKGIPNHLRLIRTSGGDQ